MPRGAYDCTGAAPGSFASRQGRQMYPCGGGSTPRASQMAIFPGSAATAQSHQHQSSAGSTTPRASQMYGQPMQMGYSYAAPQTGYMPPQQQQPGAAFMSSGPGFAPSQPQLQTFTHYGYSPSSSTMQMPAGAGVSPMTAGTMYTAQGAGYHAMPQQQQQQYAAGFAPAQAPYYRHA